MTMRFPVLLMVLFFGISGFFSKDFKIIDATMQEWTGGLQESGKGVNYRITVVVKKKSDKIKIDGIRIKEKVYNCRIFNLSNKEAGKYFEKNDTILITSSIRINNKSNSNTEKPLFGDCSPEASIDYLFKGRKRCIPVSNIKKLKPEYYK